MLATREQLLGTLVNFYTFIFSFIFTQPNHWLYSTPTVEFNINDPEFGCPTATVVVENERYVHCVLFFRVAVSCRVLMVVFACVQCLRQNVHVRRHKLLLYLCTHKSFLLLLNSRGFVCAGTARNFQMFYGVFVHKYCYENAPGTANDGWKICGFFEENKGAFTQNGTLFSQTIPALP